MSKEFIKPIEFPSEFPPINDELRNILGTVCFRCRDIARLLRDSGLYEVKSKAEDEQAAAIHWLLSSYFKYGPGIEWRDKANQVLSELADKIQQQRKEAPYER